MTIQIVSEAAPNIFYFFSFLAGFEAVFIIRIEPAPPPPDTAKNNNVKFFLKLFFSLIKIALQDFDLEPKVFKKGSAPQQCRG